VARVPTQAAAAAFAGADVSLCGVVGDDGGGQAQLTQLREAGVDVGGVRVAPHCATGAALIVLTPDGENSIVVGAGANALLGASDPLVVKEHEARDLLREHEHKHEGDADLPTTDLALHERLGCRSVVVSLGAAGAVVVDGAGAVEQVSAPSVVPLTPPAVTTGGHHCGGRRLSGDALLRVVRGSSSSPALASCMAASPWTCSSVAE